MFADVAGHDVTSSYVSATFLGILSSQWDKHQEPLELLKVLNMELLKLGNNNSHICATAILKDTRRNRLKIANSGNPGGLLVTENDDGSLNIRELMEGGMCLGLLEDENLFISEEIQINRKSILFFFSDGIDKKHMLDILLSGINIFKEKFIKGLCQQILDLIIQKYGQNDDMTLLCIYVQAKSADTGNHYEFQSTYAGVDDACRWAQEHLVPEMIPNGKDSDFMHIAIREVLLNAVEHGNNMNPQTYVDLSFLSTPDELRINISDEGCGYKLNDKIAQQEELDGFQVGKRGLPLIRSIADSVEVTGGTVSLVFKKK